MANKNRVAIFIDGSNFYNGLKKDIGTTDIDFNKLGYLLCGKNRKLVGTYYYNAALDLSHDKEKYKKQQRFFEELRKIPKFSVILVRLQKRKIAGETIYVVKGDDVHIAVDMVMLAQNNSYDICILVSGDGDFSPAVEAVQSFDKKVENAYFKSGHSWHLKNICNKSILMDKKFLEKCIISEKIPPKRINKKNKK